MAITSAIFAFAFILACYLPYSTGRPKFKAATPSDMAPRGQLGSESPLQDQFSFRLPNNDSGLLPPLQHGLTLPNLSPTTTRGSLSSRPIHAEEIPQSCLREEILNEAGDHQCSSHASAVETSKSRAMGRIVASSLLYQEESSATKTSLTGHTILHQMSLAEARTGKRPATHIPVCGLSFTDGEKHEHRLDKLTLINAKGNKSPDKIATSSPRPDAALVHRITHLKPHIENIYQEPTQSSLVQVHSLTGPVTSTINNSRDAEMDHSQTLLEDNTLVQGHPAQKDLETSLRIIPKLLSTRCGQQCEFQAATFSELMLYQDQIHIDNFQDEFIKEDEAINENNLKSNQDSDSIFLGYRLGQKGSRSSTSQSTPISPKNKRMRLSDSPKTSLITRNFGIAPIDHGEFSIIQGEDNSFSVSGETHFNQSIKTVNSNSDLALMRGKLIAWISSSKESMCLYEQRFMSKVIHEFLGAFKQSQKSESGWCFFQEGSMGKMSGEFEENLKRLEHLVRHIWYLNSSFLKALKIRVSNAKHKNEQMRMFKWLLKTIMQSKIVQTTASTSNIYVHDVLPPKIHEIQASIRSYLGCKDEGDFWLISFDQPQIQAEEVHIPKFKMTEVAIDVIKLYYKSINSVKWKNLFSNENLFACFLATITKQNIKSPGSDHLRVLFTQNLVDDSILPWYSENTLNNSSPINSEYLMELESNEAFHKMTESHIKLIEVNPKQNLRDFEFNPGNHDPRVFVWISAMAKKSIGTSFQGVECFWGYLFKKLKTFGGRFMLEGLLICKVREVFREVWFLNFRLLESFGVEYSSSEFQNEMKCIQEWLLELLLWEFSTPKSPNYPFDLLWKETIGLPRFYDDKLIWRTPCTGYKPSNNGKRSREIKGYQVAITKAAIKLIGCYYKVKNHYKWSCVYQHDDLLVTMLVQVANRVYTHNMGNGRFWGKRGLNSIKIIPWKDDWRLGTTTLTELRLKFFGTRSRDSSEKLITSGVLENITQVESQ